MKDITKDAELKRLINSLSAVLGELESRGVEVQDALGAASSRQGIPVSIFNPHLGALESIVKYMREELLLDYGTIASMLGRNPGPIGVTYRRAKNKLGEALDISSKEKIPFEALRAKETKHLSVLESLAYHLAKQGYDWHEIAQIVCRHDKTVWTVLDRAKRKLGQVNGGRAG